MISRRIWSPLEPSVTNPSQYHFSQGKGEMKKNLKASIRIGLISFGVLSAFAVSGAGPIKSAKEVVQRFISLDVEGARLTSQGWRKADTFFAQSSEPPRQKTIVVIAKHYGLSEGAVNGNRADYSLGYEELGQITPLLQFVVSNSGVETRSISKYNLILTDENRRPVTDEKAAKEMDAAFEWRIEGTQPAEMHIGVDAAMRYLADMREQTKDTIAKKNADKSLVTLKSYR